MTIHPSRSLAFENLKPDDILQDKELDHFRENVLRDLGRVAAYAILGYADWLHYTCIRYIEGGGLDDLSRIEESITWPDDISYKTKKRVIDNIYMIIRPILIDAQYYKKVPEPNFDVVGAVNWLYDNLPKEQLEKMQEVIGRSLKIMEEGYKKKPYTDKLIDITKKGLTE